MSQQNSRSRPPKRHDSFSSAKKGTEGLMPGSAATQVRKGLGSLKVPPEETKSNNGSNKSNPRSIQSGKNATSDIKVRITGKSPNKRKIITGSKLKQREGKVVIESKIVKDYVPQTPQQEKEEPLQINKLSTSERRRRANSQKADSDRSVEIEQPRQNSEEPKFAKSEFLK